MPDALVRNSMTLFAREVAPRLREHSARTVRASLSRNGTQCGDGAVSDTMVEVRGRKVALIESGRGDPLVYLHGFADVHRRGR
jgi:hypothetical protein